MVYATYPFSLCSLFFPVTAIDSTDMRHADSAKPLFIYIDAAEQGGDSVSGCDTERGAYRDGELQVQWQRSRYTFADGVELTCTREWDELLQPAAACAECWISYEVSASREGERVSPQCKQFISECQLQFWLKCNRIRFGMC